MTERKLKLYLLDIEGTVAPLSLTTAQLFPYARKHFREFLSAHRNDPQVAADLEQLAGENCAEVEAGVPRFTNATAGDDGFALVEDALAYLLWLMDRDRKSTALKSLQGRIWKVGFESGRLKGTLFDDVPEAFARWSATGKVAIYSSGSAEAQRLLFGHSIFGDLTPLIAGYFDTRTGPKIEPASYAAIAKVMQMAPGQTKFFSDVVKELDAAREAGFQTRLVVRKGNTPVEDARGHPRINSF